MKRNNHRRNTILLTAVFLIVSIAVYMLQILIFKDPKNTGFYLLQDLAFVPVQVILVSLFINELLNIRENRVKEKKINVMISTFFIEAGTGLIRILSKGNENLQELRGHMAERRSDNRPDTALEQKLKKYQVKITCTAEILTEASAYVRANKPLILGMLENQHILEHDSFTDMLWAVFHMSDELGCRDDLECLPETDMKHLSEDFSRAYRLLILEWLDYMRYLRAEYPYLHSLALRNDPFSEHMDVRVLQ